MPMYRASTLALPTVRLEQTGRVLTCRVDAPPFNYMTTHMQRDLIRLVDAVERDKTIGAVVVTGALPGRYITHFDIADLLTAAESVPQLPRPVVAALLGGVRAVAGVSGERLIARSPLAGMLGVIQFHEMVLKLLRSPAVWIGAVNGPCGGGGLELSLFFDLRVAAEHDAVFVVPELSIGLTTTVGGQRLTHLVGPARAIELLLEARQVTAREAARIGLVNRVVPAAALLQNAQRMAARYATRPRQVVAAQKRIVNEAYTDTTRQSLTREGIAQIAGVPSRETRAALRAWLGMQEGTDGDSVFLTNPDPWAEGTAVDMNVRP
ncbi:enoyl-CoA hydratase/isomerase family protein [Micromonospora sp. NPDC005324]|uniref:enoyl-CoA hydratase/isomerase family protein n=1 Tax=Micromonospora sp. NPDC005324 TaxID=3157033 RepID=UPI0033A10550